MPGHRVSTRHSLLELMVFGQRETGWLAQRYDIEDLARGIKRVVENELSTRMLGRNTREKAIRNFDYSVVCGLYARLYEKVPASMNGNKSTGS
ncbi:MAG: hypothetical protein HGB02_00175 [Chlorobiaceae bacterium]|nr:hypothetical protein [Chlorobiaceae bacterium]